MWRVVLTIFPSTLVASVGLVKHKASAGEPLIARTFWEVYMVDKIEIKVDASGSATITKGKDTTVGKLLAKAGRLRVKTPLIKKVFPIK